MSEQVIEIVVGPEPEAAKGNKADSTTGARVMPSGAVRGESTPGEDVTACVCPECGYKEDHKPGEPCRDKACPKCGANLKAETTAEKAAQEPPGNEWICPECGYRVKLDEDQLETDVKCPKCGPKREKGEKTGEKGENSPPEPDPALEGEKGQRGPEALRIVKAALEGLMERMKGLFGSEAPTGQIGPVSGDPVDLDILGEARGFKMFTAQDGRDWLLTWTTNAFEDREGEIFSTKSIEDYVSRHADDPIKGGYWFWHIPGTKFGDITWQGVVGRFLVEAGPFTDDPVGQAFKAFFQQFPEGHDIIAPLGWGTSHGYAYKVADRMDGVYDWFDKRETTVLPSHTASNPYTAMEVKEMALSQKQREALAIIGGPDLVQQIEERGAQMTKELEDAGVAYKGENGSESDDFIVVPIGGFAGQIAQVAAQVEDPALAAELKEIAAVLREATESGIESDADADQDLETETEETTETKAETAAQEEEEGEKATWTTAYMNSLPDSSFLFVQSGGKKDAEGKTEPRSYRHLPYKDAGGAVDLPHLRNAISRLGQPATGETEKAGDWLTEDVRTKLLAKARAILAEHSKEAVDMGALAARLNGLSVQAGGEKGLYLGAIAQAMAQVAEASKSLEMDEQPVQDEPPEEEADKAQDELPDGQEDTAEDDEPADVKALVQAVADALQLDALSEVLTGLKTQVETMGTEVKALQEQNTGLATQVETLRGEKAALEARLAEAEKTDELRLAEKETNLPRFSWYRASEAAQTVVADHTADGQKAAPRGPGQAGMGNPPAPLSALVGMMGGKDQ